MAFKSILGKHVAWVSPDDHRKFDIIFVTDIGVYWTLSGLLFIHVHDPLDVSQNNAFTYSKYYRKSYEKWLRESGYVELGAL